MAGLAQGLTPTLTPFSVDYDPAPSPRQEIVTALQFIFSGRVPTRPPERLAADRLSRPGLVVTAVAALAMIILAAVGGLRLG